MWNHKQLELVVTSVNRFEKQGDQAPKEDQVKLAWVNVYEQKGTKRNTLFYHFKNFWYSVFSNALQYTYSAWNIAFKVSGLKRTQERYFRLLSGKYTLFLSLLLPFFVLDILGSHPWRWAQERYFFYGEKQLSWCNGFPIHYMTC